MHCVRRFFLSLIASALLIALALPASAEGAETADSLRSSVVHLYGLGYGEDGQVASRWSGSGFAVGSGMTDVFLTNWHVVTGNGKYLGSDARLWLLLDGARFYPNREPMPGYAIECRVLAASDGYPDVAVIQAMEPVEYPALPLLSSRRVKDGTSVYALGFPGLQATRYGAESGAENVVITEGTVTAHKSMANAGFSRALIHTAAIEHGNSGGPLVNAQGAVVGQNTYGFEASVSTSQFCSLYTDYGMELLDGLGISYDTVPGDGLIPVLVCNALHLPNLPDAGAYGVFAGTILLAGFFLRAFCRAFREAMEEIREKRAKKQETQGENE